MNEDLRASDAISSLVNYFPPNKFVAACADPLEIENVKKGLRARNIKIDGFDSNGQTALVAACKAGNEKAVKLLLNAGANPAAGNKQRQLPHEVARNQKIKDLLDERLTLNNLNMPHMR